MWNLHLEKGKQTSASHCNATLFFYFDSILKCRSKCDTCGCKQDSICSLCASWGLLPGNVSLDSCRWGRHPCTESRLLFLSLSLDLTPSPRGVRIRRRHWAPVKPCDLEKNILRQFPSFGSPSSVSHLNTYKSSVTQRKSCWWWNGGGGNGRVTGWILMQADYKTFGKYINL